MTMNEFFLMTLSHEQTGGESYFISTPCLKKGQNAVMFNKQLILLQYMYDGGDMGECIIIIIYFFHFLVFIYNIFY